MGSLLSSLPVFLTVFSPSIHTNPITQRFHISLALTMLVLQHIVARRGPIFQELNLWTV